MPHKAFPAIGGLHRNGYKWDYTPLALLWNSTELPFLRPENVLSSAL